MVALFAVVVVALLPGFCFFHPEKSDLCLSPKLLKHNGMLATATTATVMQKLTRC